LAKLDDGQTGGAKIIEEFKAARREKREALRGWLKRAYRAGEKPATPEQPNRFALLAAMKGDRDKEMPPETLKKAQRTWLRWRGVRKPGRSCGPRWASDIGRISIIMSTLFTQLPRSRGPDNKKDFKARKSRGAENPGEESGWAWHRERG